MVSQYGEEDIPRLRSFTGPGAADEVSSKASKKKNKRDPSPLSRMGSSLLRPFKSLSRLRTSRSSDKDGKLQGQSRAASHTDSLASRATSASTQDAAGPSRFNSASLQTHAQSVQSGRPNSDSFQFRRRTATEDAPDLAAEPSFAQDLPQNRRSGQAAVPSLQPPVLTSKPTPLTASGSNITPGQPSSLSSSGLQRKVFAAAAETPAATADSDDEFDYDLSQPAAAHPWGTAAPPTATLLHPKVTSTSALQAGSTSSDSLAVNPATADSSPQALSTTAGSSQAGGSSSALTAGTASQQGPAGFSVEPGKFRPQRSRAAKPLAAAASASVYSPLQSGAATSPTMRGDPHTASREGATTPGTEAQPESAPQVGPSPMAGFQQASRRDQGGAEMLHPGEAGQADKGSEAPASPANGPPELLGGGLLHKESKAAQGGSSSPGIHAAEAADSPRGPVHSAPSSHSFLDNDSSSSPSLSPASSASSSEFDILETLPDRVQPPSMSSSPGQPHVEPHLVQRSAYSDTPILGPSTHRQPGIAASAASASAAGQSSNAMLSHREVLGSGVQQARMPSGSAQTATSSGLLAGAALPAVPRRGFSDKPILAVYSRRPSADGEASPVQNSSSQAQSSDSVLQTKVACSAWLTQFSLLADELPGKHVLVGA